MSHRPRVLAVAFVCAFTGVASTAIADPPETEALARVVGSLDRATSISEIISTLRLAPAEVAGTMYPVYGPIVGHNYLTAGGRDVLTLGTEGTRDIFLGSKRTRGGVQKARTMITNPTVKDAARRAVTRVRSGPTR